MTMIKKKYSSPVARFALLRPCDLLAASGEPNPGGDDPATPTDPDPAAPDLEWD